MRRVIIGMCKPRVNFGLQTIAWSTPNPFVQPKQIGLSENFGKTLNSDILLIFIVIVSIVFCWKPKEFFFARLRRFHRESRSQTHCSSDRDSEIVCFVARRCQLHHLHHMCSIEDDGHHIQTPCSNDLQCALQFLRHRQWGGRHRIWRWQPTGEQRHTSCFSEISPWPSPCGSRLSGDGQPCWSTQRGLAVRLPTDPRGCYEENHGFLMENHWFLWKIMDF